MKLKGSEPLLHDHAVGVTPLIYSLAFECQMISPFKTVSIHTFTRILCEKLGVFYVPTVCRLCDFQREESFSLALVKYHIQIFYTDDMVLLTSAE